MPVWWPITPEGQRRLQKYLGRAWAGFLLTGIVGLAIGHEIKQNIDDKTTQNGKRK